MKPWKANMPKSTPKANFGNKWYLQKKDKKQAPTKETKQKFLFVLKDEVSN